MFAEAIALFFAIQSGLSGSDYTRDVPGYSTENFLFANQIQASVFVHGLQDAVKRGDRLAVVKAIRLPLRVNGPPSRQVRHYRTQSEVLRNYDRIFQASALDAIAKQNLSDLGMLDGNYMIGNGDIWFGQACLGKFCNIGPFEIFVVNKLEPSG
jgi:hypothetical protein